MGVKYDEKSCGVVLFRETEAGRDFLLLHYPGGHWDFVKGHVEEGETEKETANRELIEETGIGDMKFIEGFRDEMNYKYRRLKKMSHKQVIYFLGKTELEDVRLSHEHHGFIWLPYKKAMRKLTFDNGRDILRKANDFLQKNF